MATMSSRAKDTFINLCRAEFLNAEQAKVIAEQATVIAKLKDEKAQQTQKIAKLKEEKAQEIAKQAKELAKQAKELAKQAKELAKQAKELAKQAKELAELKEACDKLEYKLNCVKCKVCGENLISEVDNERCDITCSGCVSY
jgi:methyl-accepting chemotaxis protein